MDIDDVKDNVGEIVVYSDGFGRPEYGIITNYNQHYAFVRYGTEKQSKATSPSFISPVKIPSDLQKILMSFAEVASSPSLQEWAVVPNSQFDGDPPAHYISSIMKEA